MSNSKVNWSDLAEVRKVLIQRGLSNKQAEFTSGVIKDIYDTMRGDIVHFTYEKKCGEYRNAYGTLDPQIIARYWKRRDDEQDSQKYGHAPYLFSYYDLVRRDWRCALPENILSIDYAYNAA